MRGFPVRAGSELDNTSCPNAARRPACCELSAGMDGNSQYMLLIVLTAAMTQPKPSGDHAAIPKLPQPRHEILLRPVGLHPAAVGAQQLQVFDVVQGTGPLWDDIVSLQGAVRELATAPVEPSLLLG